MSNCWQAEFGAWRNRDKAIVVEPRWEREKSTHKGRVSLAMNIVEPIFAQCRNKPSELALCAPGTPFNLVSYARLRHSVNNICARIISADVAPRSRIAVLIEDPLLHVMMIIALTKLGIVTVSASIRDGQWPLKLDGVIVDRQHETIAAHTVLMADAEWTEGDGHALAEKHVYRASSDDLCRIFLTFGNEHREMAIALTHGMMAARVDRQKLLLGPCAPFCDRTHLDLPLGRLIGFQVMLGTLWRGGALVMTGDAQKALAAIATYKVQNIVAAPRALLKLADAVQGNPGWYGALSAVFSLRGMGMGQDSFDRVRSHLCSNLTVGYVTPDATMVASMPAQLASADSGTAGYLLPGVMVEIVDDQDQALPTGHDGNLRIRSEYGVREYFEDPEATRRAFRNGWFYPGDRGHLTAENVLVLSNGGATETASGYNITGYPAALTQSYPMATAPGTSTLELEP
jgi:acyl-CoA synthetase (AMP-forming)/AMP-acid ligase II